MIIIGKKDWLGRRETMSNFSKAVCLYPDHPVHLSYRQSSVPMELELLAAVFILFFYFFSFILFIRMKPLYLLKPEWMGYLSFSILMEIGIWNCKILEYNSLLNN